MTSFPTRTGLSGFTDMLHGGAAHGGASRWSCTVELHTGASQWSFTVEFLGGDAHGGAAHWSFKVEMHTVELLGGDAHGGASQWSCTVFLFLIAMLDDLCFSQSFFFNKVQNLIIVGFYFIL